MDINKPDGIAYTMLAYSVGAVLLLIAVRLVLQVIDPDMPLIAIKAGLGIVLLILYFRLYRGLDDGTSE